MNGSLQTLKVFAQPRTIEGVFSLLKYRAPRVPTDPQIPLRSPILRRFEGRLKGFDLFADMLYHKE